jgi:thioredoxin reductase/bacterioferritin-associated ferredoxin
VTVHEKRELLVIGAGPAGLAAAIEARRYGLDTLVVDERHSLGGQIYKQCPWAGPEDERKLGADYRRGQALIAEATGCGAEVRMNTVAYGIWGDRVGLFEPSFGGSLIQARRIVLAPGAYDRPVAFPGWTLPGVISAGGAHSLAKVHQVLPGDRILMVGSGPLMLAFAAELTRLGARLVAAVEAAPRPHLMEVARFTIAARSSLDQVGKGLGYFATLLRARVPLIYEHVITAAEGGSEVQRAVIARCDPQWRPISGSERSFDVDTVCVGYGLVPSNELALLAGCEVVYDERRGGYVPVRHDSVRTTVPEILAVGDGAGIAGSAVATKEGEIAGLLCALDLERVGVHEGQRTASLLKARLRSLLRFQVALGQLYPLGAGIYDLATQDTVVCRCEEITAGEIQACVSARPTDLDAVKALTRAGMGRCQGRNCWRQVATLLARSLNRQISDIPPFTARPPVKPVPIGLVADEQVEVEPVAEVG